MVQVAITSRVIQLVHEILSKRIHTTKRDLFYCDPKLFQDQARVVYFALLYVHFTLLYFSVLYCTERCCTVPSIAVAYC